MGSFGGHILPGTFFICFGIWWTYSMFCRYFKVLVNRSVHQKHIYYSCSATYECRWCPNIPVEGFCKIIATSIGIIAEGVTAVEDGKFVYIGNSQHMTMFLFFGINGVTDVLLFYGFPLPLGSDYMTMSLATAIEALLFCFHLHGRTPLDTHVHTLLIISIFASTLSCLVEWKYRYSLLSSFSRALCALLQGTWFYQVGFTLYPPFSGSKPIDQDSHREIMLITAVFCWHIAAIMLLVGFIGYCFYLNYRSIIIGRDISPISQSSDLYSDIKYRNIENDVSLQLLTSNATNTISDNLNNNSNQNKYSLDESDDEEL